MSQPEYLLIFMSLLIGLGLAQLVESFHRLVVGGERVRWHWLPMAWAGLSFLLIVQLWWGYFDLVHAPAWSNLFLFLVPLTVLVLLYLICAAALPDLAPGQTVDLETFHFQHRRWFFGLGAALFLLLIAQNVLANERFLWGPNQAMRISAAGLMVGLAWTRNRAFHTIVTFVALAMLLTFIVRFTLRLG